MIFLSKVFHRIYIKLILKNISDGGYKMVSFKIENNWYKRQITEYILAKPKEGQIKDISHHFVFKQIDKMPPIADNEIKKYVNRILEEYVVSKSCIDFSQYKFSYTDLIKKKIK